MRPFAVIACLLCAGCSLIVEDELGSKSGGEGGIDAGRDARSSDAARDVVRADAPLVRDAAADVGTERCMRDEDCNDLRTCNGIERCAEGTCTDPPNLVNGMPCTEVMLGLCCNGTCTAGACGGG
jgi:hypothetical protein